MADGLFRWREIADGVFQITNVLDERAYLVRGDERALLVDTCSGYGDIFETVKKIVGDMPTDVALTHSHYDHVGGTFGCDRVFSSEADGYAWEDEIRRGIEAYGKLVADGTFDPAIKLACMEKARPRVTHIAEGDTFDLGGLTVEVVGLAGHTAGSIGFLVRERKILISGDAVTPIMCLWFGDSLPIAGYRETLSKMAGLDFDVFYTGHHADPFDKSTLKSFDECAAYAETARGMTWQHALVDDYRGTIYLAPCGTDDVDSPDFRALIGPYVPRVRKPAKRRKARPAEQA
jgi:glyoxylase-like metal-dependent hydrolase (beta-lactamase superfamily II)